MQQGRILFRYAHATFNLKTCSAAKSAPCHQPILTLHLIQVAEEQLALLVTEMHTATLAIAEEVTLGTLLLAHPLPITIRLEALVPHLPEAILVDIALMIVGTDACARRD